MPPEGGDGRPCCHKGQGQALPLRNNFNLLLDHIPIRPICFDPFCRVLQRGLQKRGVVPNHRADDNRILPLVLQIHLRDRDIKLTMQTRDERFDAPALFFEGGAGGEVEVNGEGGKHSASLICRNDYS